MQKHPSKKPQNLASYLTTHEAARLVGVSNKTLRRWDNAGILKPARHPINHYRLYNRERLIELIREPEITYKSYHASYSATPLRDFASITPRTDLESLNLNWRERDLPERERTKHVHRLHPYLGKFIPQLVEIFLRKFRPKSVCDPFSGSGTTLVEANVLGMDAYGCDISEFNCLIAKVKTDPYDVGVLENELRDILTKVNLQFDGGFFSNGHASDTDNEYLRKWFAPKAREELLAYRSLIPNYQYQDAMKLVLCRAARSSRLTSHFDLDFPKVPQRGPYYCYKHDRTCQPTENALQFLNRYTLDAIARIKEFSKLRTRARVRIYYADSRKVKFPKLDAAVTSPPYVGLIDYHEQHRYAYELLGLEMREQKEIGAAFKGSSEKARAEYIQQIGEVFDNLRPSLRKDGVVVIVANDRHRLYEQLPAKIGYRLDKTITRHVNRRTGRRSTDFYEEVLIWRPA